MKVDYFAGLVVPSVPGTASTTGDTAKSIVAGLSPVPPVSPAINDRSPMQASLPSSVKHEEVNTLPEWCRADCKRLEIIEGVGPGCVRALDAGPWREEWRRLDTMATCPKRMH